MTTDSDEPEAPTTPSSAEEMALVERLRARDRAAFGALLDRFHTPLLRMARMYVSSHAVAEEVVQETWLGVLGGIATFEARSSLKTWIFRILVNRAKTRGVREARTVPFSATEPEDGEEPAVSPDRFGANGMWSSPPGRWAEGTPEKLLADKQAVAQIARVLEGLPERQRIVLTLRDIEGFDADEVGEILGVSETNQRVLLHRARSKVRNELELTLSRG